jgi:hypothetical protein
MIAALEAVAVIWGALRLRWLRSGPAELRRDRRD